MKIVLINPNTMVYEKTVVVPLGLAYVAASLEKKGFEVTVVDLNVEPAKKLWSALPDCDIIGLSANTLTFPCAKKLLLEIKRVFPKKPIVVGGPHATAAPRDVLANDFVDFLVLGEGETVFPGLCGSIIRKRNPSKIRGIGYKRGKKLFFTGQAEPIQDLDSLPFPAYNLFPDLGNYTSFTPLHSARRRTASILTSRGCPYNCCFCFKSLFGRKWRARSAENVVSEWEFLVKEMGARQIAIIDDAFNTDRKRVERICDLVLEKNLAVAWQAPNGIRADLVSRELLLKMKKSGCYKLAFGVESGSQEILNGIGKNISIEKIKKAFRLCKEIGIETTGFFIIGLPGEDRETMQQTIDLAIALDPDFAQFTMANPLPGTAFRKEVEEHGRLLRTNDEFSGYFDESPNFVLGSVSPELVIEMRNRAYRSFYFRPKYIIKKLLDKNTWRNPRILFGAILHLLRFGRG